MYSIEFAPSAASFLEKLHRSQKHIASRLIAAIDELRTNPYLGKKLMGKLEDRRSLRVGDYRVIYGIIERRILIQIVSIGHRRDIYR